jgi:hypothetical protein
MSVKLQVSSPDELRDALPQSGVFEMTDCKVQIDAPGDADEADIEKMITMINSIINVTNITVTFIIDISFFHVKIEDVPLQVAEGRVK